MDPVDNRMITIEWEMMDKKRFFAFSAVNSVGIRVILYPLTVIKTRLQVQKQKEVYRGTFDAFSKIVRHEGYCGLYKGFWINTMQVVSGIGYLLTYEKVRHLLTTHANIHDSRIKGLIGGGCGSLVSQTIITPFDVISQHLMVLGTVKSNHFLGYPVNSFANPLEIDRTTVSRSGLAFAVIKELYKRDGIKGFYRGYFASLNTYVPSSALWWMFYSIYTGQLFNLCPLKTSHMLIHCAAGTLSGMTVAVLTNPLDVVRANIQVQRIGSFTMACRQLWLEEHFNIFLKGLSARLTQSSISSAFIVIGYETLKRWSLREEHKDKIRW